MRKLFVALLYKCCRADDGAGAGMSFSRTSTALLLPTFEPNLLPVFLSAWFARSASRCWDFPAHWFWESSPASANLFPSLDHCWSQFWLHWRRCFMVVYLPLSSCYCSWRCCALLRTTSF